MFVLSIKAKGKKRLLFCLAALLLIAALLAGALWAAGDSGPGYETGAATAGERLSFLRQFGWEVREEPLEQREVVLPRTFNDVYARYNEVQVSQGLDLTPYAGKRCEQWVYEVLNYPTGETGVRATLLVYGGRVIGGDLCSPRFDGFLTGFLPGAAGEGPAGTC